jgi:hypothetical protein
MLFLGLGTGLGSALIVDGIVEPMELGHLPYKKATFEDYVGLRGLERFGKKWKSLAAHSKEIKKLHLRKLFAQDAKRGERFTAEAADCFWTQLGFVHPAPSYRNRS